ncbi:MAG: glycosyltransferase family 39 protein [bacterium]
MTENRKQAPDQNPPSEKQDEKKRSRWEVDFSSLAAVPEPATRGQERFDELEKIPEREPSHVGRQRQRRSKRRLEPYKFSALDFLALVAIFVGSMGVLRATSSDYGMSWDEAYYLEPSKKAAEWLVDAFTTTPQPFSREAIDQSWGEISELPSVCKFILGLGYYLTKDTFGDLRAMRFPVSVVFALTLCLIFLLTFTDYGRWGAFSATAIYFFLPRVFGHAHFGATETITAFFTLLTVYCFLRGLVSPSWSLITGIAFGLALATKINCVFLPIVLLLWAHIYVRPLYINNFFCMVFISPLVFLLVWPWVWHDTAYRILSYFAYHASHQYTALFYFGVKYNYGNALAPWNYPFVMVLLTTPLLTLALALLGLGRVLANLSKHKIGMLYFGCFALPLAIAALPSTPKYDGTRLFFPAFPFLAIMGGIGLDGLRRILPAGRVLWRKVTLRNSTVTAVFSAVVISGLINLFSYHPFELSFFNSLIGGIEGAYNKGMETTYWCEALTPQFLERLNKELPRGAKVKPLAFQDGIFPYLQRWGMLRSDLVFDAPPPYDYHLLLIRRGFFMRPEATLYEDYSPLDALTFKDVPMVALYKTGLEFETRWPQKILGNIQQRAKPNGAVPSTPPPQ